MRRIIRFFKSLSGHFPHLVRHSFRLPSRRQFAAGASIIALAFLCVVVGAAIMFYEVAPAESLRSAFMGITAWANRSADNPVTSVADGTQVGISRDDPGKTFDGFTLYTSIEGPYAFLIDMRGNIVHKWRRPFGDVWPAPAHIKHPVRPDLVHWFRTRPFPNGDLLAIYQTDADTPHGYGLAKLDKDSKVLWACSDNVHHDLDIGDDGRIYTLTHQISKEPIKDLDSIKAPFLEDYVLILTPEGKELEKISIVQALFKSPYSLLISSIKVGGLTLKAGGPSASVKAIGQAPGAPPGRLAHVTTPPLFKENGDVLHANGIRVLNRSLAARFPLFKEGQVLLSLSYLNTLVVLDVPSRSIVWAAQGLWVMQHDPEFLENGHLLVYDNSGLGATTRVLEFDPNTHGYPWSYASENSTPFCAPHRGMKQHLPNGNVLIVDPDGGRLLEVTQAREMVWQYVCPAEDNRAKYHSIVTSAARYPPSVLKFLEGVPVRP